MMLTVEETAAWLRDTAEDVWILTHQNPDGDAIGSAYGLYYVLRALGKRAHVVCQDPIPALYSDLLPQELDMSCQEFVYSPFGYNMRKPYPAFPPKYYVSTDVADPKLLGDIYDVFGFFIDLAIDHHRSNTMYAGETCLQPDAAAACQVLYEIVKVLELPITPKLAACLYTGIATDTGCFKFENTTARTHQAVAELMAVQPDLPYARMNRMLFDVKSLAQLQMERQLFSQAIMCCGGACVLFCVSQALLKTYGLDDSTLEGVSALPLQIEGAEIGITMREREPGVYKVSLRSAGSADVSSVCQQFGGGGHLRAAGCLLRGTEEEVRRQLIRAAEQELNRIERHSSDE